MLTDREKEVRNQLQAMSWLELQAVIRNLDDDTRDLIEAANRR